MEGSRLKKPGNKDRSRFARLRNESFAVAMSFAAVLLPAKALAGTPSAGTTAGAALVTATHVMESNRLKTNLPVRPSSEDACDTSAFAQTVNKSFGLPITHAQDLADNMVTFGLDSLTPPGAAGITQAVGVAGAVAADIRDKHTGQIPVTIATGLPGVVGGLFVGGAVGDLVQGVVNEGAGKLGAPEGALPQSDSQALLKSAECVLRDDPSKATAQEPTSQPVNPNFSQGRQGGPRVIKGPQMIS